MLSLRSIFVLPVVAVLQVLGAGSAHAQQGWSTYSGVLGIGGEERRAVLSLTREPLGEWQGGKKVVTGWRYQGMCSNEYEIDTVASADSVPELGVPSVEVPPGDSADGEFFYKVYGLSQGTSHSAADSTELHLTVKNGDAVIARIIGQFDTDTTFSGTWMTFDGDHGLRPFTLRLEGEWTDEEYQVWYDAEFMEFWQGFREALRGRDREKIASVTRFPILIGSCVTLFNATSPETGSDVPLSRTNLLKKFDRVFDSLTSAYLINTEAVEAGVYQYWPDPADRRSRILKDKFIHWVGDPSGRRFEFARIGNRYLLVHVRCEDVNGGC